LAYGLALEVALVNTVAYGLPMTSIVDRNDWLRAAVAVLSLNGVDAVRVEPLARELGVTKGSFYWHFTDRAALLDAVLEAWEESATHAVVRQNEQVSSNADERLVALVIRAFGTEAQVERAIRAWAAHDARAMNVLKRVDVTRIATICGLFVDCGLLEEAAESRARLLYTAYIGEMHISVPITRERRIAIATANVKALLQRDPHL
jgi:AcrR family transcriptional regulator